LVGGGVERDELPSGDSHAFEVRGISVDRAPLVFNVVEGLEASRLAGGLVPSEHHVDVHRAKPHVELNIPTAQPFDGSGVLVSPSHNVEPIVRR